MTNRDAAHTYVTAVAVSADGNSMPQRPDNRRQPRQRQPDRPEFELAFGKGRSMKFSGWRGFFLALAVVLTTFIVALVGTWVIPTKSSTVGAHLASYFGQNQPKH